MFLAVQLPLGGSPRLDLVLAAAAALTGLGCDTLYIRLGLLDYAVPEPWSGLAPYWILVMWANFGLTLNHSLRWLQNRLALAALLGALGAPLAYLAGVQLGAAVLTAPPALVYGAIALAWAVAAPALLALARWWRYEGGRNDIKRAGSSR